MAIDMGQDDGYPNNLIPTLSLWQVVSSMTILAVASWLILENYSHECGNLNSSNLNTV